MLINPVNWSYVIPAIPMLVAFALTGAVYFALRFTEKV